MIGAQSFSRRPSGGDCSMRVIRIGLLVALAVALVGVLVAVPRTVSVKRGQIAPDFQGSALDGRAVSLANFRGKSPVVLNFFSQTCPPCHEELPHLGALAEKYGSRGLRVVLVSLDEDREVASVLPRQAGVKFPVLIDTNGRFAEDYGVQALPHTVVIDRRGLVHAVVIGADLKALDTAVEQVSLES